MIAIEIKRSKPNEIARLVSFSIIDAEITAMAVVNLSFATWSCIERYRPGLDGPPFGAAHRA